MGAVVESDAAVDIDAGGTVGVSCTGEVRTGDFFFCFGDLEDGAVDVDILGGECRFSFGGDLRRETSFLEPASLEESRERTEGVDEGFGEEGVFSFTGSTVATAVGATVVMLVLVAVVVVMEECRSSAGCLIITLEETEDDKGKVNDSVFETKLPVSGVTLSSKNFRRAGEIG